MRLWPTLLTIAAMATGAAGQGLDLPRNAALQAERSLPLGTFQIPQGVWTAGDLPTVGIEGALSQQAWRIAATGLTSTQLIRPLRAQLRDAGYEITVDCAAPQCGGFDFRFAIDVLPAPDMQVNLRDYHYIAAMRAAPEEPALAMTILASRTANAGFVQIMRVGPPENAETAQAVAPTMNAQGSGSDVQSLAEALELEGGAVLEGLSFGTGSSQLSPGPFPILQELAEFLRENPDTAVALVGHTDAEGSLAGNITLSKRRAGSVLERLVTEHDVPRAQLAAEGMGYLAPVASNQTEEGRLLNRRVEVIITSTTP